MRNFILILTLIAGSAFGQTSDILLEACNSMQDATKRLECLKAAVSGAAKSETQTTAINALKTSFNNMNAILEIGISHRDYQTSILELAKAVASYKQSTKAENQDQIRIFEEALGIYGDAGVFWERSISFYARRDNNISYAGGLPIGLNHLEWLVSKYQLPTTRSDLLGFHSGLPVDSTRSLLWKFARTKAEEGFRLADAANTKNDEINVIKKSHNETNLETSGEKILCKFGTSAPINTSREKCQLIDGVIVND